MRKGFGFCWAIIPEPSEILDQIVELFRKNQRIRVEKRENVLKVGLIIHGIQH